MSTWHDAMFMLHLWTEVASYSSCWQFASCLLGETDYAITVNAINYTVGPSDQQIASFTSTRFWCQSVQPFNLAIPPPHPPSYLISLARSRTLTPEHSCNCYIRNVVCSFACYCFHMLFYVRVDSVISRSVMNEVFVLCNCKPCDLDSYLHQTIDCVLRNSASCSFGQTRQTAVRALRGWLTVTCSGQGEGQ